MAKDNDNVNNNDSLYEGKDEMFMDVDRMVNEGLGGGTVTRDNGLIEDTTTDTMDDDDSFDDVDDLVDNDYNEEDNDFDNNTL